MPALLALGAVVSRFPIPSPQGGLRGRSSRPRRPSRRDPRLINRIARRAAGAAVALFVATVCAEIVLAPASASLFSRITVAGLVLNLLAIPLMTIAQAAAICTLAASPIAAGIAASAGYVAHLAATGLVRSALASAKYREPTSIA